jgi:hypothetical protein
MPGTWLQEKLDEHGQGKWEGAQKKKKIKEKGPAEFEHSVGQWQ